MKLLANGELVLLFKKKKIMDDIEITDGFLIAEKLNNFSVDIGPKLASKTLPSNNHYS